MRLSSVCISWFSLLRGYMYGDTAMYHDSVVFSFLCPCCVLVTCFFLRAFHAMPMFLHVV